MTIEMNDRIERGMFEYLRLIYFFSFKKINFA